MVEEEEEGQDREGGVGEGEGCGGLVKEKRQGEEEVR